MFLTILLTILALVAASIIIGIVLGIAGGVLVFLLKVVLLAAAVYFVIRLISPRTADRLREKFESRSLPRI
jgi:hypothetical protein